MCLLALGLRTQFAVSRVWGWARPEGRPEQQKPFQTPLRSLLIFFKHANGHWGTVKNTRVCISVSCCGKSLVFAGQFLWARAGLCFWPARWNNYAPDVQGSAGEGTRPTTPTVHTARLMPVYTGRDSTCFPGVACVSPGPQLRDGRAFRSLTAWGW